MTKKKETYASISKKIKMLLERQGQEKQRIAGILADVLLTEQVTSQIGDYTDTDLKKLMQLLSGYLYDCIDRVENTRRYRYPGVDEKLPVDVSEDNTGNSRISDTAIVQ